MAQGIDHFFVSKDATPNIVKLTISDSIFAQSRHKSITLELENMMENPLGVKTNYRIPYHIWSIPWFKQETEAKISALITNFNNDDYDAFILNTTSKASKISKNLRRNTFDKIQNISVNYYTQ